MMLEKGCFKFTSKDIGRSRLGYDDWDSTPIPFDSIPDVYVALDIMLHKRQLLPKIPLT